MDKKTAETPNCMDRREFLKLVGTTAAAGAAIATLGGCGSNSKTQNRIIPTDKMTYRTDPKNGNRLSLLGFGMMRLPRIQRKRGESLPDTNDLDQETVNELVDYAIAHGVNVFDTSPLYCKGFSEKATGEALSRHPRDKYYIATKLSNSRPAGAESRDNSMRMYHKSFEDLKVDYIDYYFVHNVGSHEAWKRRYLDNGMLDFLFKEKEVGRIRNLGWSFHGDGEFFEYMVKEYPWDFVMIQLNYLDWSNITERANVNARRQYELVIERDIPVWIMEPLLGGALSMPHYKARELMVQADPVASAASWAFRFAGSLPNVTTVLSGMMFMDHLQDNIITYSPLEPINDNEKQMLENAVDIILHNRMIVCTACQYCMPCPYGIDIPEIFTHYNRCLNEGNFPDDRQSEDYKRARRAFLVGMDRSVSPVRQADRCINCGLCVSSCPQRIPVPQEMRRIDAFVEKLRRDV
ncbi:MAG: aldo/keto reductase [Chitinispirillales bacterium]|nr:aldo/keto reductase [Chitinispirillales bacterium]